MKTRCTNDFCNVQDCDTHATNPEIILVRQADGTDKPHFWGIPVVATVESMDGEILYIAGGC